MGIDVSLSEIYEATKSQVCLLGNLPPRDVLAAGSTEEIEFQTKRMLNEFKHPEKLIASCGGGMPPGVTSENIEAFIRAISQ